MTKRLREDEESFDEWADRITKPDGKHVDPARLSMFYWMARQVQIGNAKNLHTTKRYDYESDNRHRRTA
jgi:hypothetical protein